jgi:AraC-like DNA-binding protein
MFEISSSSLSAAAPIAGTLASNSPLMAEEVPFQGLTAWVRAATQCRFNISPLFATAGLDMASSVPRIRKGALIELMKKCVAQAAPHHHFPLVLGELYAFDHLPALDTFMSSISTLRDALPALVWVNRLMPHYALRFEESEADATLLIDVNLPSSAALESGYFVETFLAGLIKIVGLGMNDMSMIKRIEFKHDPGAQLAACEASMGLPIQTLQPSNAVVFQRRMLDIGLPGAVPELYLRAQQQIEVQLPSLTLTTLGSTLAQMLREQPDLLGQGLERLAQRLQLHPRTLQRRLRDEGLQFGDIQSRCRQDLAMAALVRKHCDIEVISAELGFTDRHSFTRAFKRWTGLTPSEYRRQQMEPHPEQPKPAPGQR